jgi:MraZ protein
MSFIGQYIARLDAKNRAFLPAPFRRVLQDSDKQRLIIRKDYFENCLIIYPLNQWMAEIEKVRSKLNRFDASQQMVYRKLISEAQEVILDNSGRMLIPRYLLDKVGISQDILFVGMEQTIEMWAPAVADTENQQHFMTDADFAGELKNFMTK